MTKMQKLAKIQIGIPSIHGKSRVYHSCIPKFFNGSAGLRAKVYKVYTNFTENIYFKLGGVVGNTYNRDRLIRISA
jgi:hypothetical protein